MYVARLFSSVPRRRTSSGVVRALLSALLIAFWGGIPSTSVVDHVQAQPAAQSKEYVLGPGDVLSVAVLDQPKLSVEGARIDSSGKIRLPMAGSVMASGKTVAQVEQLIEKALGRELLRPNVTVTLAQPRERRVFVQGAVRTPGIIKLEAGWRVSEVLVAAGGLAALPESVELTLSRGKAPTRKLNLLAISSNSASPQNVLLESGDVLRFTSLSLPVRVAGQVRVPGAYDVPVGGNVWAAIALAGGFAPRAAPDQVTLTRANGSQIGVDLRSALEATRAGRPPTETPQLQAGDLVLVPESNNRVTILGAVGKPGDYNLETGITLTVAQSIVMAGGVTPKAALTRATLTRGDGSTRPLDLFGLLVEGQRDKNLTLQSGDIITIPEVTGVTVFGAVRSPNTYPIEEGRTPRVMDVLTLAGSFAARPEDVRLRVVRAADRAQGAKPLTTDELIALPDGAREDVLSQRVFDGDAIFVEELKPQTVFVTGEVKTTGPVQLRADGTLIEAITRAGGPTPMAALTEVTLTRRDGRVEKHDLLAAIKDGAPAPGIRLEPDDRILVPKTERVIYVMDAVNAPGYYAYPDREELTLGEAITLAGGPRDRARLREVAILRETPEGIKATVVDLQSRKGDQLGINVLVQPRDVVYVPPAKVNNPSFWSRITSVVGALNVFRIF